LAPFVFGYRGNPARLVTGGVIALYRQRLIGQRDLS
jgi:hypothetical protein